MTGDGTPFRPATLGRYEVLRELSGGGQGVVYLARQFGTRRTVALKRFLPAGGASISRELAEREVQAAARLDHPGLVTLYGLDEIDAQWFLVMEYVDGVPLTRHASERALDPRAALALLLRVCDAVQHAHQRGVLHRDLKADNILVDAAGQPHVLDFGLAHCVAGTAPASASLGTLPYAAPERLRGEPGDVRADVYALGVLTYEMLTGRRPHEESDGVASTVHAILSQNSYLCGATHDFDDPAFPLLAYTMEVGAYAWVAARACVAPGVNVGEGAILGLASVATRDLEPWGVYAGSPAVKVKQRKRVIP